jgi:RHS repeat-associated protein
LYNGNIAETFWQFGDDGDLVYRGYGYKYDSLNRLKDASYQRPGFSNAVPKSYDENLTYDKNGNIMTLKRNGDADDQLNLFTIDDLSCEYLANSNKLMRVSESQITATSGFKDGNTTGDDYEYDDNGNLIKDKNKDITTAITYNHLNLPTKIIFPTGNIVYIYTASGQKMQKIVTEGTNITTTDYLGGYQYQNTVLQFFPTAEGYVKNTPVSGTNTYSYVYNYTDHLGNVRLSYTKNPSTNTLTILEENSYYPFGLKHTVSNAVVQGQDYKYKFNGKELQDELQLNLYDFGARNYDPALGRWMNIDPLAEVSRRWNPYTYCYSNPIRFTDPDGMLSFDNMNPNQGEVDPDGMSPNDWIRRIGEDGKSTFFFDSTIKTQEQATQVYGSDVSIVKEGTKTMSMSDGKADGRYSYTYHNDGTVTDASNKNVTFSDTKIETKGGTTIINPAHKDGTFSGFSIGGALGGGISLEAGIVNDPTGSSALYFSFGGNSGIGGGYSGKAGIITPTASNPFSVNDFAGKGSSWSAGIESPIGGYSIERGGTRGNSFSEYGTVTKEVTRPYTYTAGSVGDASPSLKGGAMVSGTRTWIFKMN